MCYSSRRMYRHSNRVHRLSRAFSVGGPSRFSFDNSFFVVGENVLRFAFFNLWDGEVVLLYSWRVFGLDYACDITLFRRKWTGSPKHFDLSSRLSFFTQAPQWFLSSFCPLVCTHYVVFNQRLFAVISSSTHNPCKTDLLTDAVEWI